VDANHAGWHFLRAPGPCYIASVCPTGIHVNNAPLQPCPHPWRCAALLCASLFSALPAVAQERAALFDLVNAYRATPQGCDGRQARPVAPLTQQRALSSVQVGPGIFLDQALERAGYPVARAEAIYVSGALDARAVMDTLAQYYCTTLRSTEFSAIGASRQGANWQIVLAQPAPPARALQLPGQRATGSAILDAVNAARSVARRCGEREFAAAPALSLNTTLTDAALGHSRDMAAQGYFSHQGKDGRSVAERALAAGYRWRRIGENIAVGQDAPDEVVAGWLASPGHCASIMDPGFADTGAAYALSGKARAYWTQVFGTPLPPP
jgi:uncharacterized protein YkwD